MQTNINQAAQLHADNLGENQKELKNLGTELNGKTSFVARKEAILTSHMESIVERNKSWVERITMSSIEKGMLRAYAEKQEEAVDIILDHQNKSLAAMGAGQVAFIKEVVNTLLKTGRAGLKASSDLIFMEYRIQRAAKMEALTSEFYNLIERKLRDAEGRPQRLQELKLKEIEVDLKKWEEDYKLLQDEFSNILTEQV